MGFLVVTIRLAMIFQMCSSFHYPFTSFIAGL
jgi:hypothetical protein